MDTLIDFWSPDGGRSAVLIGIAIPIGLALILASKIRMRRARMARNKSHRGGYFTDGKQVSQVKQLFLAMPAPDKWVQAMRGDVMYDVRGKSGTLAFEEPWLMTSAQREELEYRKFAEWKRDCMAMELDQLADKYYDRENCRSRVPKDPAKELLTVMERHERDRGAIVMGEAQGIRWAEPRPCPYCAASSEMHLAC